MLGVPNVYDGAVSSRRPNPLQWVRYVVTGRAPERLHEWVLHDVTSRTWVLRHCVRFLIQLLPLILLVVLVVPLPIGMRLGLAAVGVLGSVVFSFGYVVEGAERRVEKAGYPFGTAAKIREDRAVRTQRESAARRREKIAQRRARRAS